MSFDVLIFKVLYPQKTSKNKIHRFVLFRWEKSQNSKNELLFTHHSIWSEKHIFKKK